MELTMEEAREIIKVFGPNSVLYECTEPEEVVVGAREYKTISHMLNSLIAAEIWRGERQENYCLSGEEFKRISEENKKFIRDLRARVRFYKVHKGIIKPYLLGNKWGKRLEGK